MNITKKHLLWFLGFIIFATILANIGPNVEEKKIITPATNKIVPQKDVSKKKDVPKTVSQQKESSSLKQWYEGGNLHKATVLQWEKATYQNKLATAADWLAATKWKDNLNTINDFNKLKAKADILVKAVDESINIDEIDKIGHWKIAENAAFIILISSDLGP